MHDDRLRDEFTVQSETFGANEAARAPETLDGLVELAGGSPDEHWLDLACGPGVVSCALAPTVASVHGTDLTPAMVERAREGAREAGIANASFAVGNATAVETGDGSYDGAITRFSLHHIPRPGRVFAELARVVRSGGTVVVADHLGAADRAGAAWHEEIERLRDPSHWACLTQEELERRGAEVGLRLEHAEVTPLEMGYERWLERGSSGPASRELIEGALAERPEGAESFVVRGEGADRRLHLRVWLSRWTVA